MPIMRLSRNYERFFAFLSPCPAIAQFPAGSRSPHRVRRISPCRGIQSARGVAPRLSWGDTPGGWIGQESRPRKGWQRMWSAATWRRFGCDTEEAGGNCKTRSETPLRLLAISLVRSRPVAAHRWVGGITPTPPSAFPAGRFAWQVAVKMKFVILTACTLMAFAANSLLCRMALGGNLIDPMSFTAIRLCSGALALIPIVRFAMESGSRPSSSGTWGSGLALFAYAAAWCLNPPPSTGCPCKRRYCRDRGLEGRMSPWRGSGRPCSCWDPSILRAQ